MPRKATAKTSFGPEKAKTNANQIREWTTRDYKRECEAAVQSICDASNDEDYLQYHGSIPQHFGFREDAQTKMQIPQPHHPYNSRRLSSDENAVIEGTHQPTRFVKEETQIQQQNELLNSRVREVPMKQELKSVKQEQQVLQQDAVFLRPHSQQQLVAERLKMKATDSDQIQSDQFYQPDSRADELKKEKEVGDYIDQVIAAETIKLRNELAEKMGRGRPKGSRNKSMLEISIAHQHELNQEDYGYIQDTSSIIQQQHPALCRALGKPRKLRQQSDRANVPYLVIAGLALYNAKIPLTSKEVYRFARYYFPRCVISSFWKNSLRNSLCKNNVFKHDGITEGNAYLWSIANISELWNAINTFVAGNRDQSTYGMSDPSLWDKLLKGSMGVLDEAIQFDPENSDRPPRAPKKRANQREGDMTPPKQCCYDRQQSTPILQNYQHSLHFAYPYYQMGSNGCDEYGYPLHQNMHFHPPHTYYNQHMQMPTHANNQHPPTVFPGYPFPDPSYPFPSLFVPNLPVQMPFPLITSFHEESTSPESQGSLQSPMAHLYVGSAEDGQNGGEH